MKITKELLVIFIIMITEVLGFSLILPFLPYYAETLGASALQVGFIFAVFSLFQFFSAPIMGRLSDNYGRRPLLMFSQLSTFISFIILGMAGNLWMIYLSRIVDGMFGSNMTIAQAYISDISTKEDRSKAFGLSGVAFGVGFLIGPAAGGALASIDYSIPSFLAAGISLITILTTYFFLPETVQRKTDFRLTKEMFHIQDFRRYFNNPKIAPRLWIFFTYVLTHSIYVSSFALYAKRQLDFGTSHVGYLLTYVGVISIVLRGFLLSRLIDWIGERKLEIIGAASVLAGMLLLIDAGFWTFLLAMTLFASGSGVSRPVMSGQISRKVSEKEQGSVLGITSSLGSISRIIGPVLGGFFINFFFPGSLGIIASIVMAAGLFLLITLDTF